MNKIIDSFKFAEATGYLIVVNIIMFLITMFIGQTMYDMFAMYHPSTEMFHPIQIISHMFMHGGIIHLVFNMFVLWQFGRSMEKLWGHTRFIIFYIACGLGSVLLHNLFMMSGFDIPMVGASGAIYGLVAAFVSMYPNQNMSIMFLPSLSFKAWKFILIALGVEFVIALSGVHTGIAHWVHIGGALTGFLLFIFWLKTRKIKWVRKYVPKSEDYIESKAVAHRILGYDKDIAFDKKVYINTYFDKICLFDTSLYTNSGNMIWQGDFNMTDSEDKVKELAKILKTTVYLSKNVNFKKNYIYKTTGSKSGYQNSILKKYKNKI